MINKSETLKVDIRAYQASTAVDVKLLTTPETAGSGSYRLPTTIEGGLLSVGINRVNTPQNTFDILAHELGHFKVEGPSAVISKARADAVTTKSSTDYEAACHLTEGYGKYNETLAHREVLVADRAQALAEGRAPTRDEAIRAISWGQSKDELLLQDFERLPVQFGAPFDSWSAQDLRNAAIYAMGENNRENFTSTSGETYAAFCKRSADIVIGNGATSTSAPSASLLETEFDLNGLAVTSDFSTEVVGGGEGVFVNEQVPSGNRFNAAIVTPTSPTTYDIETTIGGNSFTATGIKNADGNVVLTGLSEINGQPPFAATSSIANAALAGAGFDIEDLLLKPNLVLPYVEAVDATNANGTTASLVQVTGRTDWWNDPAIGNLASDTVGLISALRSGRPLPIATAGFNFASHNFSDPAVANIAFALSGISNLAGLVGALERGDLGRILIDGGGVARTALTIYGNNLTQQMISQYGNVFRAGELAANGNAAAAELYNANLGVEGLVKGLGQAVAVLNIINSLANGDIKGAFIGAVTLAFPVAGATIAAIDMAAANDSAWAKAA